MWSSSIWGTALPTLRDGRRSRGLQPGPDALPRMAHGVCWCARPAPEHRRELGRTVVPVIGDSVTDMHKIQPLPHKKLEV